MAKQKMTAAELIALYLEKEGETCLWCTGSCNITIL